MIVPKNAEEHNVVPTANVNNPAFVESAEVLDAPNSSREHLTPAQSLKASISFRTLVESDERKLKKVGQRWGCRCPFHSDNTPSFFISEDDTTAKCFGCGWYGDIFKYVMDRTESGFHDAFWLLSNNPSLCGTKKVRAMSSSILRRKEFKFSVENLNDIARYTTRIGRERWLAESIASVRNWKPETIEDLAASGSLGWAGDCLAFIFKTGIKIRRWPGRDFRWEVGEPSLWRSEVIANAHSVYITEGETDAISLLDAGVEKMAGTAVVALPGATTYNEEWTALFVDKEVTLCLDSDEAGQNAAAKAAVALRKVAKVFIVDPKEVR